MNLYKFNLMNVKEAMIKALPKAEEAADSIRTIMRWFSLKMEECTPCKNTQ